MFILYKHIVWHQSNLSVNGCNNSLRRLAIPEGDGWLRFRFRFKFRFRRGVEDLGSFKLEPGAVAADQGVGAFFMCDMPDGVVHDGQAPSLLCPKP